MQSTYVALMGSREETILKENQLEKLRLSKKLRSSRMERLHVRMRLQEMVKGVGDRVMDWIWKLYNMDFGSGVVLCLET